MDISNPEVVFSRRGENKKCSNEALESEKRFCCVSNGGIQGSVSLKEKKPAKCESDSHTEGSVSPNNVASVCSTTSGKPTKASESKISMGASGDSKDSSHTKFLKRKPPDALQFVKVTREEFEDVSETISGSSDTFQCEHGPEGRKYTEKGLLKRFLLKKLDPAPNKPQWKEGCQPDDDTKSGEIIEKLVFLVSDSTIEEQIERLIQDIQDYTIITKSGFKITELDNLRLVLDFLIDNHMKNPRLIKSLEDLIRNMDKPIRLILSSDISKYFESLQAYMTYLGYLLMTVEQDDHFDLIYAAVVYQLTAPNATRGNGTVRLHQSIAASATLHQMSGKMIAVASPYKFPYFLKIPLMLAYISAEYCIKMMEENIIENIFYRFNPYYPHRKLPDYDINPRKINNYTVKLGESSKNLDTTLTLLLVLIKTTKEFLEKNPAKKKMLPCPDIYAQKCFVWAYRYECRAQAHKLRSTAERITMTIVVDGLLYVFGDRLEAFTTDLMPDVLTMSVLSELPPRGDWTSSVPFDTSQLDVQFKKVLIRLSISFIRAVPVNRFMVTCRNWLLGLTYLLDPSLSALRVRWVPSLYNELKKLSLQTLVLSLPLLPGNVVQDFGLIRRILWFIEWYMDNPYELSVLYWATRVLQTATYRRSHDSRVRSVDDLVNTHGLVIIIKLCHTLLDQKNPPIEMSQVILGLCLRILTSCVQYDRRVKCIVYPDIRWPTSVSSLAWRMLDFVVAALEVHSIIYERWLIPLLNFIWEGVVWKKNYRKKFIEQDGIFKLLDLITMTRTPTQCMALAIICDVARAGEAVGHLVSWRASIAASHANPPLVKRGATIAVLLAAIFRDDCHTIGVKLDDNGIVILDTDYPLMSSEFKDESSKSGFREGVSFRSSMSLAAAEMASRRCSKVFAILYLLSEDLSEKLALVDEAYNLYKNVELSLKDEITLVLCSYYQTAKMNEVCWENHLQCPELLREDDSILAEFLNLSLSWGKEIKRQQEAVLIKRRKKDVEEENTLYAFLGRVRLNIALDALQEVRCGARLCDRAKLGAHARLNDAVQAHHRRTSLSRKLGVHVIKTYEPQLDEQNMTGQYVKVSSNKYDQKKALSTESLNKFQDKEED